MIKRLLMFTLHLFISLAAIGVSALLFLNWIDYFEEEAFIAYLYEDTAFQLIEFDKMTEMFAEQDAPFQSSILYGNATDRVTELVEKGANTIILNLSQAPDDALIEQAAAEDVVLLFIGTLPSEVQRKSYDKLFCFTTSDDYAEELLAEQLALDFREDRIMDKNEDDLLDYTQFNNTNSSFFAFNISSALFTELEHYGVYTTDTGLENISTSEIFIGYGSKNVIEMTELAQQYGLLDFDFPIELACIVENNVIAQSFADTGLYRNIVYFDTLNATKNVVDMARNALQQDPVTSGTEYAQTEQSTFMFPYQKYQ